MSKNNKVLIKGSNMENGVEIIDLNENGFSPFKFDTIEAYYVYFEKDGILYLHKNNYRTFRHDIDKVDGLYIGDEEEIDLVFDFIRNNLNRVPYTLTLINESSNYFEFILPSPRDKITPITSGINLIDLCKEMNKILINTNGIFIQYQASDFLNFDGKIYYVGFETFGINDQKPSLKLVMENGSYLNIGTGNDILKSMFE